jgi:serine phosphatase RsbU (regulator of sigma subunit)
MSTVGGSIEWLVIFDIPLHIAWLAMPLFTGITGYAIIRYRAMEIDTVIHRTILWAATIFLLIIPVSLIIAFGADLLIKITFFGKTIILTLLLLVFLVYYNRLKPQIDHLFRRRKYDYQMALSEIPTRVGTELDLYSLCARLFKELKEVLYLQNGLLLIKLPEATDYTEAGSTGYGLLKQRGMAKENQVLLAQDSVLIKWFSKNLLAVEREQMLVDPTYNDIRAQMQGFFESNYLELLIPICLKNSLTGILGLGKKENLKPYTQKDIQLLEKLGQQIGITLDNALHHQDIVEKERLAEELRLGREIQTQLLPKEVPIIEGLSIAGFMEPAKEIGGDYFDYLPLTEGRLAVVIGDVSGKGVGAGLLMAVAKTAIHTISTQNVNPRQVMVNTNNILYQYMQGEKFMTMLYLEYNPKLQKFVYSSAGHEHILHYKVKENRCIPIKSGGFMLGMLPEIQDMLEDKEIILEQGDKIVLYTDGVTEAENSQKERFGLPRLIKAVESHPEKGAQGLLESLKSQINNFIGTHPQYDDITLISMEKA